MLVSIWHKINGNLLAEVKSEAVPRVGEHMDLDNEKMVIERVCWVVVAEEMAADVFVRPENGHLPPAEQSK
jgi:hypothetical protein